MYGHVEPPHVINTLNSYDCIQLIVGRSLFLLLGEAHLAQGCIFTRGLSKKLFGFHSIGKSKIHRDSLMTRRNSRTLLQGFAALFLDTLVIFLMIFVVSYPIYIKKTELLSNSERSAYVLGVTLSATCVTAIVTSAIQGLLAKRLDGELDGWDPNSPIEPLSRQWRAILNLDGFLSKFRTVTIHACYWIAAIMTTAIATSLSPTPTTRTFSFTESIRDGPSTQMNTVGNCTAVFKIPLKDPTWPYYWNIGNEKVFLVQTKQGDCPTRDAQLVVGNINSYDAGLYAYMDAGVAVHQSALGVPRSMYSPETKFAPDLDRMLNTYGENLVSTQHCSRVMVRNPISCHRGGSIIWKKPWLNISADDGECETYRKFTPADWDHYNNGGGGVMLKTMCAHHEIGQGTMVVGAEGGYAHWLAVSLNDLTNAPPAAAGSTYIATCTVDARNIFEYREVKLHLRSTNASQTRFMRFLNATGQPCVGPAIIRDVIATAASANWQTLLQQAGADGWWDLVWEAASGSHSPRPSPYGFPQSTNALEDVLGLVSAMVTSRMNSSQTRSINATAAVRATRVGNGDQVSLAFCIPPVVILFIFFILLAGILRGESSDIDCTELEDLMELRNRRRNSFSADSTALGKR